MTEQSSECHDLNIPPAQALYVELATRIATRRLHYRSGDEETAVASIQSLFDLTRKLMTDHPNASLFGEAGSYLLNKMLGPHTDRWHGWMTRDGDRTDKDGKPVERLRDEWVRRKFREELRELQPALRGATAYFGALAKGQAPGWSLSDRHKGGCQYKIELDRINGDDRVPDLGFPLPLAIRSQVGLNMAMETGVSNNDARGEMLALERAYIINRRVAMGGGPDDGSQGAGEANDVFGVALSGGGIRSATFCLGVVQELHKQGLFNQIDYLSTVSGGGYLGAFLSSYLGAGETADERERGRQPKDRVDAALGCRHAPAGESDEPAEPVPVRHLRNHSNYLLHGGILGILRVLMVFANGLFVALLMILSLPLLCAWIVRGVKASHGVVPDFFRFAIVWLPDWSIFHESGGSLVALLLPLGLLMAILRPFVQRIAEGSPWNSGRARFLALVEDTGSGVAVAGVLAALLSGSFLLVRWYDSLEWNSGPWRLSLPKPPVWIVAVLSAAIPVILGLSARSGLKKGPINWSVILLTLCGPVCFLIAFVLIASALGVGTRSPVQMSWWAWFTVILLLWLFFALNINTFSPARYYRDRLCECYLAIPGETQRRRMEKSLARLMHGGTATIGNEVGTVKAVPLSAMGANKAAPYHIINATINCAASRNPELRGRAGDFFLFSRHYCGSSLTGYITTEDMEKANPGLDLGTAMAISGAAASVNMGRKTRRELRFLLSVFNIRLGYWMRRPGVISWTRYLLGPSLLYFFREMTGALHERTRYINLSDGGHIENLAVYELLRRQCKFIVCVDGGMEPGMECDDLVRLQRLAEIDFGIRMDFDPRDLGLVSTGFCRAPGILVKIDYAPNGRTFSRKLGWMLYLKLGLTGTEPRHVLAYHRQHPEFPHQTTGDQLYDEAQFESYRSLGQSAAATFFRAEILGDDSTAGSLKVRDWFQCLAGSLLEDNDEVFGMPRFNCDRCRTPSTEPRSIHTTNRYPVK